MGGGPTWDAWQREHIEALAHLQERQREYHRTVAARALAESAVARAGLERQSLDALDAARAHLDQVRRRRPEL